MAPILILIFLIFDCTSNISINENKNKNNIYEPFYDNNDKYENFSLKDVGDKRLNYPSIQTRFDNNAKQQSLTSNEDIQGEIDPLKKKTYNSIILNENEDKQTIQKKSSSGDENSKDNSTIDTKLNKKYLNTDQIKKSSKKNYASLYNLVYGNLTLIRKNIELLDNKILGKKNINFEYYNKHQIVNNIIQNSNNKKLKSIIYDLILVKKLQYHHAIIFQDPSLYLKYNISKILGVNVDFDINNINIKEVMKLSKKQKKIIREKISAYSKRYRVKFNKYKFKFAFNSIEGHRKHMEDGHLFARNEKIILFGVFDGHGGNKTSMCLEKSFAPFLFKKLKKIDTKNPKWVDKVRQILTKAFFEYDQNLYKENKNDKSGSTAILMMIIENILFLINLGDSRGIIFSGDELKLATIDHKPSDQQEKIRIKKAGGYVSKGDPNRVMGNLAVSRAFADFNLKAMYIKDYSIINMNKPLIISITPDIYTYNLDKETNKNISVVLACDGIWDIMSNKEIIKFLYKKDIKKLSLKSQAKALAKHCINSYDNITVFLIKIIKY